MFDGYSCVYGGECVGCRECEADEPLCCEACGEDVEDEDGLRRGLCPDCQRELKQAFADLLLKEFTSEVLGLIDDALDGVSLCEFIEKNKTEVLANSLQAKALPKSPKHDMIMLSEAIALT